MVGVILFIRVFGDYVKISTIKNFQMSYIYNENRRTFATFSLVTSPTLAPIE